MRLTEYTALELTDLLAAHVKLMRQMAEMYEKNDFGTQTEKETNFAIRVLFEEMLPIVAELARRFPNDHVIQQRHRDFRRYGLSLRET